MVLARTATSFPFEQVVQPECIVVAQSQGKKIALKKHPEITGNVRSIIQQMTGSALNKSDMSKLEKEIIDNITLDQGKEFKKVVRSKRGTLILRPAQWHIVEEILSGLPKDDLWTRVRDAHARAKREGKIRYMKVSVDP